MLYSRRQFGALTLAGLPATAWALANLPLSTAAEINSRIKGVQGDFH